MYPLLRSILSNLAERGAHARRVPNHSLLLPVDSNLKRQRYTLIFNPLAHLRDRDLSEDSSTVGILSRLIESSLLVLWSASVSVPRIGCRLREAVTAECAMRRMHPAHTRDPHESQGYALARWCKSLSLSRQIPVNRALTGTLRDLADPDPPRFENSNLADRVASASRFITWGTACRIFFFFFLDILTSGHASGLCRNRSRSSNSINTRL